jgi:ornithine carbamoyltransferase
VVLAHPEGYHLIPETVELAGKLAAESGGSFKVVHSMQEAFDGADVVYPKSWAPYAVMEKRTELLKKNDTPGLKELEQACLARNAEHKNWECTEEKMKLTKGRRALYMHCLPADISGVSCVSGEVAASVFERYRIPTYVEAGFKPYVIAAVMLASRFEDPVKVLRGLKRRATPRAGV